MDFSLLFSPLRFLISFWDFSFFRILWFGFFLLFVLSFIRRIVRSDFY